MHIKLFFVVLALGVSSHSVSGDYQLVWSDEFDQAEGTAPNPDYWGYNLGGGGWGNGESQYYTNRLENARIEGGNLIIEMRHEPNYSGTGYNFTSARLLTQNKLDWQYGRIEARIQVPAGGSGLWPAFWMLGSNISSVGWPRCGEIDIMEYISRRPNEIFGTIHGPGYAGGASFGKTITFGEPVANDYHTYAVEWERDVIRWYLNGELYHQATPQDVAPNDWVFNDPQFIILNMAIGGNFGGSIDLPNLTFPAQLKVDYVRVYQTEPPPSATISVPGRIEAEASTGRSGIQTEATLDQGGGQNIGWISTGDWVEYHLSAERGGRYELFMRYASPNGTARVALSLDGVPAGNAAIDTATGGWQTWQTVRLGELVLPQGVSVLRLSFTTSGGDDLNINWLEAVALELDDPSSPWQQFPAVGSHVVDTGTWLGLVYTADAPWVYSYLLGRWAYVPDDEVSPDGGWLRVMR
jgi:beta-glucanase (GH16 family)